MSLIINIVQLAAVFSAIYLIRNLGKGHLLLFGNLGMALCNVSLGVLFYFIDSWQPSFWFVFGVLVLYMAIYGVSIGPAIWLYIPEVMPAKIVPFATISNYILCSIAIIIFPVLNTYVGDYAVFFVFGGISLFTFVVNYFNLVSIKEI